MGNRNQARLMVQNPNEGRYALSKNIDHSKQKPSESIKDRMKIQGPRKNYKNFYKIKSG